MIARDVWLPVHLQFQDNGDWKSLSVSASIPDAACSILLTIIAKIFALDFRNQPFIVL
jgi:hypothetical protein